MNRRVAFLRKRIAAEIAAVTDAVCRGKDFEPAQLRLAALERLLAAEEARAA
jgi:hypothetical protein